MKNGLFHKSIGFPQGALTPWLGTLRISHTQHSYAQCYRRECRNKVAGGVIDIPEGERLEVEAIDIVEVEIENGRPIKALVRLQYDDNADVCFALLPPQNGVAKCKTLWTLHATDHHKTLDLEKYSQP